MFQRYSNVLFAAVVGVYTVLNIIGAIGDGATIDEPIYIGVGHAILTSGNLFLNPFHPVLIKTLAGLALLPLHLNPIPAEILTGMPMSGQVYPFILFDHNFGRFHLAVFWSRLSVIAFNSIMSVALYAKIRKLFGDRTAWCSMALLLFSSTVLAHSRYVTLDVACMLVTAIASLAFTECLTRPTARTVARGCLWCFLGMQTKFPFLLVMAVSVAASPPLLRFGLKRFLHGVTALLASFLISVIATATLYQWGVEGVPHQLTERYQNRVEREGGAVQMRAIEAIRAVPGLRGLAWYVTGAFSSLNLREHTKRVPVMLGGQVYFGGKPAYFPLMFAVKETVGFLAVIAAALACALFSLISRPLISIDSDNRLSAEKVWVRIGIVYLLVAGALLISSTLNIGIRHLLPVYPFAVILSVRFLLRYAKSPPTLRIEYGLILMICLQLAEVFSHYPHLVSFYNYFAGGSGNGYRWSLDSNFDWGQDSLRLLEAASDLNIKTVYTEIQSTANLNWYGYPTFIVRTQLHEMRSLPSLSFIALSRQALIFADVRFDSKEAELHRAWFARLIPVREIGDTILLFRVP